MFFLFRIVRNVLAGIGLLTLIGFGIFLYIWLTTPLLQTFFHTSVATQSNEKEEASVDAMSGTSGLSTQQEARLQSAGIDPAVVSESVTPEMEACFIEVLGQARVNEIKEGDVPTASEIFKARVCISTE